MLEKVVNLMLVLHLSAESVLMPTKESFVSGINCLRNLNFAWIMNVYFSA